MSHATPETVSAPALDKSTWGPGPWQDEPDRVDWVAHGFACFALRHADHGCWCAYVGVPHEHPLYGQGWQETPEIGSLDAHRGINYSAACFGIICHAPEPAMPADVWWLGFDCGQFMDLSPGHEAFERAVGLPRIPRPDFLREVYRDLPYVRRECERLAEQLAAMAG